MAVLARRAKPEEVLRWVAKRGASKVTGDAVMEKWGYDMGNMMMEISMVHGSLPSQGLCRRRSRQSKEIGPRRGLRDVAVAHQ